MDKLQKKIQEAVLNEIIKEIDEEMHQLSKVDQDLDEMTTTGDVAGYMTPHAFASKKDYKKYQKNVAQQAGMKIIDDYFDED